MKNKYFFKYAELEGDTKPIEPATVVIPPVSQHEEFFLPQLENGLFNDSWKFSSFLNLAIEESSKRPKVLHFIPPEHPQEISFKVYVSR